MQILNEYIYKYLTYDIRWSWIGIILIAVLLFGGAWLVVQLELPSSIGLIVGIAIVLVFFLFFVSSTEKEVMRYEIVLTDDISYKEFTSQYKIIEKRGDIIVVEKKGIDENE